MTPGSSLSLRREGSLPRLWIDSSLASRRSLSSPTSSDSSARRGLAQSTLPATPSTGDSFYVRGLYDFESPDPDQLSFRKNDLLEIVKTETTGWWAAIHLDDKHVGWIPSSFVEPLVTGPTTNDEHPGKEPQVFDYDTTTSALSPPGPNGSHVFGASAHEESRTHNWMPLSEESNVPHIKIFLSPQTQDQTPFSPLLPPEGVDSHSVDADSEVSPIEQSLSRFRFNSSTTDTIQSPRSTVMQGKYSGLPVGRKPLTRKRSASLPLVETKPFEYQKSRSESISSYEHRQLRRRPLLIDDRSSLNRLTTLFETRSLEELEDLVSSPDTPEGLGVLKRTGLGISQRFDQVPTDVAHHPLQFIRGKKSSNELRFTPHELRAQLDGTVSAGTLHALVEKLTGDLGRSAQEIKYRHVFLMTLRTFSTSGEIFELLVDRYDMLHPSTMSTTELSHWKKKYLEPKQTRILHIVKLWIEEHGLIQDEPQILLQIVSFLSSIIEPQALVAEAESLLSYVVRPEVPPLDLSRGVMRRKRSKSIKQDEFFRLDPCLVAKQICLLDHSLYSKIRPRECLAGAKLREGSGVTHLSRFIEMHNKIAALVKNTILNTPKPNRRAEIIDFWIEIAQTCLTMRNFSTTNALVSALCNPVASCLSLTWRHVTKMSHFNFLRKLVDPASNYSAQRQFELAAAGPSVPFVMMYLQDLVRINDEYADSIALSAPASAPAVPLINFLKREKYYDVVSTMLRHQQVKYTFLEDSLLLAFLEESLGEVKDDEKAFLLKSRELQYAETSHANVRKGPELVG